MKHYSIIVNDDEVYAEMKKAIDDYSTVTGIKKNHFLPLIIIKAVKQELKSKGVVG